MQHLKFGIGLELEANVIDIRSGAAVCDFSNSPTFQYVNDALSRTEFPPLQCEYDAATVELNVLPKTSLLEAFNSLEEMLAEVNQLLALNNMTLLLLGLHPGRALGSIEVTDRERYTASNILMDARARENLFYTSFQLSFEVPQSCQQHLLPLCHSMQSLMWPHTMITHASSIFDRNFSDYMCYRIPLNDALSELRCGPFPSQIRSEKDYHHFCNNLPHEATLQRKHNTWFDVLPKPIPDSQSYRIEIRAADTSCINNLFIFSQAMHLNYVACLQAINSGQPLPSMTKERLSFNRQEIIKRGRKAQIKTKAGTLSSVTSVLYDSWATWIAPHAKNYKINPEELIDRSLQPSRSEAMLDHLPGLSGNQLALKFCE